MKKYLQYFKTTYKMATTYKPDFLLSQFSDIIFFTVFFTLWTAIFKTRGGGEIVAYSLTNVITYYFATEFIFRFDITNSLYLSQQIWNGWLTNDLIKPYSVTVVTIIDALAEKALVILLCLPVFGIVYLFAHEFIVFPSLIYCAYFLITILLALFMNVFFNLIFHALTFRYGDQDASIQLVNYIAIFLGGGFFPLSFLHGTIGQIFSILPFKYLFFVPAEIFLGKISPSEILRSWFAIIIWTLLFFGIYYLIYKKGLKYYTGTGR